MIASPAVPACTVCGKPAHVHVSRYCSHACKQRAYLQRKVAASDRQQAAAELERQGFRVKLERIMGGKP